MDESGIHDGAHACVIAGYWGHERRWRSFEKRWRKVLEDARVCEFHSVDFWKPDGTRKGIFRDWPDNKADKFISDLLYCIGDSNIYPATSTLVVSAWQKLNKNERMFLTGGRFDGNEKVWITPSAPNQTYYLPFQFVVVAAAAACKEQFTVHYVFDIHKQFKNHASDLFAILKVDPSLSCRDRLGAFAMEDSKKAPGLQAADLLAYQAYQHAKQRHFDGVPTRTRLLPPILRAALKNMRDDRDHLFFDSLGVSQALQSMPDFLRSGDQEFPIRRRTLIQGAPE